MLIQHMALWRSVPLIQTNKIMFYPWLLRRSVTVNAKHVSSDHVVDHVTVNPAALLESLDTFSTPEIQP